MKESGLFYYMKNLHGRISRHPRDEPRERPRDEPRKRPRAFHPKIAAASDRRVNDWKLKIAGVNEKVNDRVNDQGERLTA